MFVDHNTRSIAVTGDYARRLIPTWATNAMYDPKDQCVPLRTGPITISNDRYWIEFYSGNTYTASEHGLVFIYNEQLYHLHKNVTAPFYFMNVGPAGVIGYEIIEVLDPECEFLPGLDSQLVENIETLRTRVEEQALPNGVLSRTIWRHVIKVYTKNGRTYLIPFVRTTRNGRQIVSLFNSYVQL